MREGKLGGNYSWHTFILRSPFGMARVHESPNQVTLYKNPEFDFEFEILQIDAINEQRILFVD